MKDKGVFSKMAVVTAIIDFKVGIKSFGEAAIGFEGAAVYWPQFSKTPENDYLVQAYKDKYNSFPDIFDPNGMNVMAALSTALGRTNGDTDPEKLIVALEGLSFQAPKGTLTIRKEDHQTLQPMYLVELKKDPSGVYPFAIPTLIKELTADESAPPIRRKP
jgi:branched-chain amino acid transport system substrate-binding protein